MNHVGDRGVGFGALGDGDSGIVYLVIMGSYFGSNSLKSISVKIQFIRTVLASYTMSPVSM